MHSKSVQFNIVKGHRPRRPPTNNTHVSCTLSQNYSTDTTRVSDCHITLSPSGLIREEVEACVQVGTAPSVAPLSLLLSTAALEQHRVAYLHFPEKQLGVHFTGMSPACWSSVTCLSLPRGVRRNTALQRSTGKRWHCVDKAADSIILRGSASCALQWTEVRARSTVGARVCTEQRGQRAAAARASSPVWSRPRPEPYDLLSDHARTRCHLIALRGIVSA